MPASPSDIHIRAARIDDAPTLADYNIQMAMESESKSLDPETVFKGVEQGLMQPELCKYFAAEINGQLVGQAMITYEWSDWRNGELWWIQSVYVHPDHRRRGVFRELYGHIETLARQNPRVRGLRLYVEADNERGQAVYTKLGLIHAGYHVYEREF